MMMGMGGSMTRLQARREREQHSHHRSRTTSSVIKSLASSSTVASSSGGGGGGGGGARATTMTTERGQGEGGMVLGATLKRRWTTNPAVVELENGLEDDQVLEEDDVEEVEEERQSEKMEMGSITTGKEDEVMMEMDGWNGLGERPAKRVTRRL
jgi:hypothetical protein